MIPVTFTNDEASFETLGLLDSGADSVTIDRELAEVLGLDLSGERDLCQIPGGTTETVEQKVNIKIGRAHENYTLAAHVKILLSENSDTPPLLGRAVLFDEFKITFNQEEEKIWLKKLDHSARNREIQS